jgi:hypothetical protein
MLDLLKKNAPWRQQACCCSIVLLHTQYATIFDSCNDDGKNRTALPRTILLVFLRKRVVHAFRASNPKTKSGWKILISDVDLRTHLRELGNIFPSEKNGVKTRESKESAKKTDGLHDFRASNPKTKSGLATSSCEVRTPTTDLDLQNLVGRSLFRVSICFTQLRE